MLDIVNASKIMQYGMWKFGSGIKREGTEIDWNGLKLRIRDLRTLMVNR